jgi:maltose alpha-D-glucosyltransferase/alpha-amylase
MLPAGLATLIEGAPHGPDRAARRTIKQLEEEVLPEFLRQRRWFAGKGGKVLRAPLGERILWRSDAGQWLIALIDVEMEGDVQQRYFLPLSLAPEDESEGAVLRSTEWTLARIREGARIGVLVDAFADSTFCVAVARAIESSTAIAFAAGEIRFTPTRAYAELASGGIEPVQHLGREQSNTSVILGESLFLKGYRQARYGVNPDMEMPRFLTNAGFRFIAPLAGAIEYVRPDGPPITLAAMFAYVRNQGDVWAYALNDLERLAAAVSTETVEPAQGTSPLFIAQMRTLGQRVGELHAVLAADTTDPEFRPEPLGKQDTQEWTRTLVRETNMTFAMLERRLAELPESAQSSARAVLDARVAILDRVQAPTKAAPGELKTRYHGDLHLGQVLLTADDFLITDFEGEPARPIEERRQKGSPLRDVAGMLRSFDYARAVAMDRVLTRRPDLSERIESAFKTWRDESCDAFLWGYREGVGDARSVPGSEEDRRRVIDIFQIEKALYELRYEMDNRPQWLNVPAGGLLKLVAGD